MQDMDADMSSHIKDLNNDMANRMSLFYANATPMLRVLSDTTSRFVTEVSLESIMHIRLQYIAYSLECCLQNPEIPIEQTTEMLSTMAKVCLRMLEKP